MKIYSFFIITICLLTNKTGHTKPVNELIFQQSIVDSMIKNVVSKQTFYYNAKDTLPCNSSIHNAFMNDLLFSARVANVIGEKNYQLEKINDYIYADDHQGLKGKFLQAYHDSNRYVFFGDGSFTKAHLFSVNGKAVIDIIIHPEKDSLLSRDMYLYLQVENGTLGFLAKVAARIPILNHYVQKYAIKKSMSFATLSRDIILQLKFNRVTALQLLEAELNEDDFKKILLIIQHFSTIHKKSDDL